MKLYNLIAYIWTLLPDPLRRLYYRLTPNFSPASIMLSDRVEAVKIKAGINKEMKMYLNIRKERGYLLGSHEWEVQSVLTEHVKPSMTVFNIGAHIGFFTIALYRLATYGKIIAFEPNPSVRKRLVENLKLNEIDDIVKVEEYAVSDLDGFAKFSISLSDTQGRFSDLPYVTPGDEIDVRCIRIDTYIANGGLIPGFIFMDVEHAEGRVLKGMSHTIEKYKPLMVIEMHGKDSIKEAFDELQKHNYLLTDCHGKYIYSVDQITYGNYFTAHTNYFKEKSAI